MPTPDAGEMSPASVAAASSLAALREAFDDGAGYLAACTAGLSPIHARAAMQEDLGRRPDPERYSRAVAHSRSHAARLLGVDATRVAIGSQTSVMAALLAASLPDGAKVLCAEDEFSSLVLPFRHAGRGIRVRTAPLATLAEAIRPSTDLVAFSLVQSACGARADAEAIATAARAAGARTLCDVTQAAGWLPVPGSLFDAVVCHAYKWLCAPRGVAFLAISAEFQEDVRPVHAGWYAGDDPWASCYGGDAVLAGDARRFDVSPAWQAFVGAEPALRAFAEVDMTLVTAYTTGLAADFRSRAGRTEERAGDPDADRGGAIVSWPDPTGEDLARLTAAGLTASGRNGRARVAFHIFNDEDDVDRAVRALTR